MMYGEKYWAIKGRNIRKMSIAKNINVVLDL
jgi:hypothetical protein